MQGDGICKNSSKSLLHFVSPRLCLRHVMTATISQEEGTQVERLLNSEHNSLQSSMQIGTEILRT